MCGQGNWGDGKMTPNQDNVLEISKSHHSSSNETTQKATIIWESIGWMGVIR